ncbi:MAG: ATP-dependent zinc metalloprotease FtsH [Candidatus Azobacteroides pseudotrichonymphae]|jgi:cell division protease FtsH|nr:MAG: ATP-dependent zinc metalloprotease FtsH [Candidatus Azobacteroides pseudotrichonymphae]
MSKKKNNNIFSDNKKPIRFGINWVFVLMLAVFIYIFFSNRNASNNKDVNWSEFQQLTQQNSFSKMIVNLHDNKVTAKIKKEKIASILGTDAFPRSYLFCSTEGTVSTTVPSTEFANFYKETASRYTIDATVEYNEGHNLLWYLLGNLLPVLFFACIWVFIMKRMSGGGGGIFNVVKNKAQVYDKSSPNSKKITFRDVAGLSEAKQEVEEIVDFLKNSNKYTGLGAKIPKGVLLVGPPGTGKTLLAKAVAGEADVPFFSISGSDFVEMFVGVGASRVRDLFHQAKEKYPCIIFIDEIDAVGRARGKNPIMGTNDERENTLNQLLTEMDGFGSNSGVIVLAATNRVDILDKALLRAGRFDRQINVELPELNDRKEIFAVHLQDIKTDSSVNMDFLARQSPGFSGADIANVCNEAALIAARNGKESVQKEDFTNAIDRIIGGLEKRSKVTTVEERKTIALHEAGHASLSWMLEYANPLVKVTIVPRGKALGAAWYMPEERQITTYQQLQDELCATLGGRAAEELFLKKISTGAANDLERITKQAYAMVVYYGMSELLPNLNYYDATGQDWGFHKPYSDDTARMIDKEVQRIVEEQYKRAKTILTEYSKQHQQLTDILLEREVIYADDLEQVFGKRKWLSRSQEILEKQNALDQKNYN